MSQNFVQNFEITRKHAYRSNVLRVLDRVLFLKQVGMQTVPSPITYIFLVVERIMQLMSLPRIIAILILHKLCKFISQDPLQGDLRRKRGRLQSADRTGLHRISPKNTTPDSKTARHGGIVGKEWAEELAGSKAGNGALGDSVVGKVAVDRRSDRMKP